MLILEMVLDVLGGAL